MSTSTPPGQPEYGPQPTTKADVKAAKAHYMASRPWYKKKRYALPLALLVVIGLVQALNGGGDDKAPATAVAAPQVTKTVTEAPEESVPEETVDPEPSEPAEPKVAPADQKWAAYTALTDKRGIDRSVIGWKKADKPGGEMCGMDPNDMATWWPDSDNRKTRKVDMLALIEVYCPDKSSAWEAMFETAAPAAPAAPKMTAARENAIGSAEDYLEYDAFSRSGLIEQLEYEDFSKADATFAVDSLDVNYQEQAAKSAKDYLEYDHFSHQGLVEQLEYEGYSHENAEYGVRKAGL